MNNIDIEHGISKIEIFEDYIFEYDEVIINHEKIEIEKYLTTFKSTQHVTPEDSTYGGILAMVSIVLAANGLPGSIATTIASALFGLGGSAVEAWITTERKFYEVYDSTGYFLGYYKVYYTIKTEAKVNGKRQVVDTQRGNYTTLFPG